MQRTGRRASVALAGLWIVLWTAACSDGPLVPEPEPEVRSAPAAPIGLDQGERTELGEGISHYVWQLDLGPGEFDEVRLHRVVRDRDALDPDRAVDAVFTMPGSPNFWEPIFLPSAYSAAAGPDLSMAFFLAQNGIDVWGIDYAWALVPAGTTDFGFMEGWGVQKDVGLAYEALEAARSIRVATGQGNGRMHVLGFSYGVPVAVGMAGMEMDLPPGRRLIKGLIMADYELIPEDPELRAKACANAPRTDARIAAGVYVDPAGSSLVTMGTLAKTDPEGASPFFPAFTNLQFALLIGAVNPGSSWHFVGGEFGPGGVPTGLSFTDESLWVDLLRSSPPYSPLQTLADIQWSRCRTGVDVSFDDRLGAIGLPILDLDAAGGAGPGSYTASQTATKDYQQILVQLLPDGLAALDFGHGDLFLSPEAEASAWSPLLDWLVDHRENRTYP